MFNNLSSTSVQDVNENDLLAGFEGETDDKKKAGGKSGKEEKTDDEEKKSAGKSDKSNKSKKGNSATASTTTKSKTSVSDVPSGDLDDAFETDEDDEDDEDQDEKDKKKKSTKKNIAKKKEEEDNEDDDDDDEENDDDEDKDDEDDEDKDKEDEDKDDDEEPVDIKDFLKARVNLFLKKGEWKKFEIDGKKPEDIEWDEDTFAEIELQQKQWQRQELKDELLDSFGPYGRDIAEYAANGGDPDKLIDIFQQQQEVQVADITTEEGQKQMVFDYQTKVLGKSKESAERYIKNLIADKELEAEAKENKGLIEKDLEEQAEALKTEAENNKKAGEKALVESQKKFSKDINDIISKDDSIPADEKQDILKVLTKFNKPLKNGQMVNEFYFKYAEFKKDLPNFVKLVRLVLNPEKYDKALKNKGKTETAEKVFSIARSGQQKKKVKTSSTEDDGKKTKKSGFRLL